jgi:fucose permease
MASSPWGALIDIESAPTGPPPARTKSTDPTIHTPSAFELDDLTWGSRYNGPPTPGEHDDHYASTAPQTPYTGSQTPRTADFLQSRPSSPQPTAVVSIVQNWCDPPINRWRLLSGCVIFFGMGMNDSAPGALIPYIEKHYDIKYAIMSTIFVAQAAGFLVSAFLTDSLSRRIGRSKSYILSGVIQAIGFAILATAPPYPVVVFVFFLEGLAFCVGLSITNVFCSNLAGSTVILGTVHGSYGIGGTIGPMIATALVSHGVLWSRYYLFTLFICLGGGLAAGWTFRNIEAESSQQLLRALHQNAATRNNNSGERYLLMALKNKTTIIGALFTFVYQGAEVSISGWVISFLISVRQGDPAKVGYVTAGFWVSRLRSTFK